MPKADALLACACMCAQGLSTMFCMTNVMKFQQQYLNWQILNWTKIDSTHIKIHLQVRMTRSCAV